MDGDWHDLGGALSEAAAGAGRLQPLALHRRCRRTGLGGGMDRGHSQREKVDVTPEAKDHLWSALTSLASAPAAERTMTGLSVLLQSAA